LAACLYLLLRSRRSGRTLRELARAAERGEILLQERGGGDGVLDRLVRAVNRLVEEKAAISGSGRESHEQFQAVLGNLREAVVIVDRDNCVVSANSAFSELAGLDGDPCGRRIDACVHGSAFLGFLGALHTGGPGRRAEMEVQAGNAAYWLEVSAAPLRDTPGRDNGRYTLLVMHDITRQKQLEKMRTEFVANVSHELRTPVTVIQGFAQTLAEDEADLTPEEKRRFLEKIRSNTERLHGLLQDLLLLSRLESAEMILQCERIRLSSLVRELAEAFLPSLDKENQRLVLELAGEGDEVLVDPLRISQVVNNLLDNVVRHAHGFSEIRIRTEARAEGVALVVFDNGAGIPQKDLPHIFQRFYRVEKGRSRESGGTGLGLSIVKHIVGQHGGDIVARSGKGGGTEIEILFRKAPAGP
jgi:two-component system phosphate regulon sensor histidine kinase PhoR